MAPRRSWAKANSPYWSSQVASWYRSNLSALEYCRRRDLSITTFELWMCHLVNADDLRKRAEKLQNLRRKKAGRQGKTQQPKRPPEEAPLSLRQAHGQRPNRPSRVLEHACRGDELEWHGSCRVCGSARAFAACVADLARSSGRIRRRDGLAIAASSECPSPIKQHC